MLDIAENITQIGRWTRESFHKDQERIALYLKLTRKDVNNIIDFPFHPSFQPKFMKFCRKYEQLEKQFHSGIDDHQAWGACMLTWGVALTEAAELV